MRLKKPRALPMAMGVQRMEQNALFCFGEGADTADIAWKLRLPESVIRRWVEDAVTRSIANGDEPWWRELER